MATSRSRTRQRLEQFLANPSCGANVQSVVTGVPMAAVASHLGVTAQSGLSPYARRAGVTFEKSLFGNDAERLRSGLEKEGLLPAGSHGLLDLRLRQQGGNCSDLEASRIQFEDFLQQVGPANAPSVSLLAGPVMVLPLSQAVGDGLVAIDVLVVDRHTKPGKVRLVVGEVKSYADRGGHTDRRALAAARAQAGLYLHVLRVTLARLGLIEHIEAADDGFLVLRGVKANYPRVRAPEELRWQAERAALALSQLEAVVRPAHDEARVTKPTVRHLEFIAQAPKALQEGCLRFCELAKHCQDCAHAAGDPMVLGEEVARLLPPGLTLLRVSELLDGTTPPANDAEQALIRQIAAR